MNKKLLVLVLLSSITLSACSISGGPGNTYRTQPTIGQELMDLESAYLSGVISEVEFNRLKAKILQR